MVIEQSTEVSIHEKVQNDLREFFKDFKCQRCGKCCQEGVGVALWPHEVKRLKRLEPHLIRHTFMMNGWTLLKLPCVFYKKGKCKIYDQRPIACKLYPTAVNLDGSLKISESCPEAKRKLEDATHI